VTTYTVIAETTSDMTLAQRATGIADLSLFPDKKEIAKLFNSRELRCPNPTILYEIVANEIEGVVGHSNRHLLDLRLIT
jgi:hypothetical protein